MNLLKKIQFICCLKRFGKLSISVIYCNKLAFLTVLSIYMYILYHICLWCSFLWKFYIFMFVLAHFAEAISKTKVTLVFSFSLCVKKCAPRCTTRTKVSRNFHSSSLETLFVSSVCLQTVYCFVLPESVKRQFRVPRSGGRRLVYIFGLTCRMQN
jgi:hypothetical protein